jgi:hypothetical protein
MFQAITCLNGVFVFTVPKDDVTEGTERRELLCKVFLPMPVDHIMIQLGLLFYHRPPAQQKGV